MKCLKCEKEVFEGDCNVDDVGYIEVTFHYGSRFDQCLGFAGRKRDILAGGQDRLHQLLAADKIQAFICDDCFEKNVDLFEGYNKKVVETKVV